VVLVEVLTNGFLRNYLRIQSRGEQNCLALTTEEDRSLVAGEAFVDQERQKTSARVKVLAAYPNRRQR
jgi:hypothetical protein